MFPSKSVHAMNGDIQNLYVHHTNNMYQVLEV